MLGNHVRIEQPSLLAMVMGAQIDFDYQKLWPETWCATWMSDRGLTNSWFSCCCSSPRVAATVWLHEPRRDFVLSGQLVEPTTMPHACI